MSAPAPRPGWRVADVVEVDDESDPSFEATAEGGGDGPNLLLGSDEWIVGGRR